MHADPICPRCGQRDSKVSNPRQSVAGAVRRRRLCACGFRFTTYEQVDTQPRLTRLLIALKFNRNPGSS